MLLKRDKPKLHLFLVLAAIAILASLVFAATRINWASTFQKGPGKLFLVKNIECKNQYGPCTDKDSEKTNEAENQSIFFLNIRNLKEKLESDFTNQEVYIHKIFPDKLQVIIEKRKPYVGLGKDKLNGIFLVSKDGTVLALEKDVGLPTLILDSNYPNPVVGLKIGEKEIKAARLLYLTHKARGALQGILKKEDLETDLPDGTKVFYTLDQDPEILVGALQLIFAQDKIQNELPKEIDLRYSKPVLRY